MKSLKLFFYYLILLLAGLYSYFFWKELNSFVLCFMLCVCCFILEDLKKLINIRSISGIIEIFKLYLYLFIFIYIFYWILINFVWMWYILVSLVLIGVFLDERIKGWRFVVFCMFVLIHFVILWNGWIDNEILIVKDLFWYSLVMLGSFVWHVLILNWLYSLVEYFKLDYLCYVVSRWSLLTSLTGILWVFKWCLMVWTYFTYFYRKSICKDDNYPTSRQGKYKHRFIDGKDLVKFVEILLKIIVMFIEYFIFVFQNYCKVLLGLSERIEISKIPLWFFVYFLVVVLLSIFLMTPRIYIIWVIFVTLNILKLLYKLINETFIKHEYLTRGYIFFYYLTDCNYNDSFINYILNNILSYIQGKRNNYNWNWELIYNKGLLKDYIIYSKCNYWGLGSDIIRYVKDVFYIFEYSPDRYKYLMYRIIRTYLIDDILTYFRLCYQEYSKFDEIKCYEVEEFEDWDSLLNQLEYLFKENKFYFSWDFEQEEIEELAETLPSVNLWSITLGYPEDLYDWGELKFLEIFRKEHKI